MKEYIHSTEIYTRYGVKPGYIEIEDGKILDITSVVPAGAKVTDYGNQRIIPGIIDVHNHGFGGWSMTDVASVEDVKGYAKAVASVGVTGVLPTAKEGAFAAIADCMEEEYTGAHIYGIHSEGPYWARGGENTVGETWPDPDVEETKRLLAVCKGKMKMMAIAPELPKAYDVIRTLHENDVLVAACHTKAMAQQIKDAMNEVGLDIVTHLCNGMQGIHHRDAGALGAYLLEDRLFYELITDLNHVCPDMIRICFKMQPYSKFCLISDSNFIAGLPTGRYERYGKEMIADEKGLIKDIHGRICGSGKWVLYNMKQLVEVVGVPFEDVVMMASTNPARFLKIEHLTGSIEPGKQADFAVITDDYKCTATYVMGNKVYDAQVDTAVFNMDALNRRIGNL